MKQERWEQLVGAMRAPWAGHSLIDTYALTTACKRISELEEKVDHLKLTMERWKEIEGEVLRDAPLDEAIRDAEGVLGFACQRIAALEVERDALKAEVAGLAAWECSECSARFASFPTHLPHEFTDGVKRCSTCVERGILKTERDALRRVLIDAVNSSGASARYDVSIEFLRHFPNEVAAIVNQRNELRREANSLREKCKRLERSQNIQMNEGGF